MAKLKSAPHMDEHGELTVLPPVNDNDVNYANVRLFVGAINTQQQLVYNEQKKPNGAFAKKWTPVDTNTYLSPISCCTTRDGRVAIAAIDAKSNTVQYMIEQDASGNGGFSPREDLGAPPNMTNFTQICMVRGVNGLDNIFVSNVKDNNSTGTWWIYRNAPVKVSKTVKVTPPGASAPITVTVEEEEPPSQPWSDWINVNGSSPNVLQGGFQTMYAANNADGRIVLCGNYDNGIPFVRQQLSDDPFDQEKWGDWINPGNGNGSTVAFARPVLDKEGRVSIFGNNNGLIERSRQSEPGSQVWDDWSTPGYVDDNLARFSVTIDADGCLYLVSLNFAPKGYNTKIYGNLQGNTQDATWTGWSWISMLNAATDIELGYNADGTVLAFVHDAAQGKMWTVKQTVANGTEWDVYPTPIGSDITSFSTTRDLSP